jgi:hypothetical protein
VHIVTVLLDASSRSFWAGPDSAGLTQFTPETWETPTDKQFTGQVDVSIKTTWGDDGRVFFRQTDPLPLTIIGVLPNVETGG